MAARGSSTMVPIQLCLPEVVAAVVRRQPLTPAKVRFAWSVAVGPALARVSTGALLADGSIRVTVTDARWADELERSREIIVPRLARFLGPEAASRVEIAVSSDHVDGRR